MRPTDVLRAEHEHVLRACAVLEAMAARLQGGGELSIGDATAIVDFVRYYADGLHHLKEEQVLFPALVGAGVPREGGPVAVMLNEHDLGRKYVAAMASALPALHTADGRARFATGARGFAELLTAHIAKENGVLFTLADRMLPPASDAALLNAYAQREAEARKVCGDKANHEHLLTELRGRWS